MAFYYLNIVLHRDWFQQVNLIIFNSTAEETDYQSLSFALKQYFNQLFFMYHLVSYQHEIDKPFFVYLYNNWTIFGVISSTLKF